MKKDDLDKYMRYCRHIYHCICMIMKGDEPFEKKKTYYFKKQIELTRKKLHKLIKEL